MLSNHYPAEEEMTLLLWEHIPQPLARTKHWDCCALLQKCLTTSEEQELLLLKQAKNHNSNLSSHSCTPGQETGKGAPSLSLVSSSSWETWEEPAPHPGQERLF